MCRPNRIEGAPVAECGSGGRKSQGLHQRCSNCLQALTASDLARLSRYAGYRLTRVGIHWEFGEDLVQDAMLAILIGMEQPLKGRHPRTKDLEDSDSLRRYLCGVIRSLAAAQALRRRQMAPTDSFCDQGLIMADTLVYERTPAEAANLGVLAQHLFTELRLRIPPRARGIVEAWAAEFTSRDEIPLAGRPRKDRRLVRALAQKLLAQLDGGLARGKQSKDNQPITVKRHS